MGQGVASTYVLLPLNKIGSAFPMRGVIRLIPYVKACYDVSNVLQYLMFKGFPLHAGGRKHVFWWAIPRRGGGRKHVFKWVIARNWWAKTRVVFISLLRVLLAESVGENTFKLDF